MMSILRSGWRDEYLIENNRRRFLAADAVFRSVRALYHAVTWIGEAPAPTAERVDVAAGTITLVQRGNALPCRAGCRLRTNNAPAGFVTIRHMAHDLIRNARAKDPLRLRCKVAA